MKEEKKITKELQEQWHNDPKNWKFGIFYFNKEDKRIFPPKRNKYLGWTVNFGNSISIIVFVVVLLALILINQLNYY